MADHVALDSPEGPISALVQELVIKVAAGAKSIRVPLGEGIAGHVGAKCAPPRRATSGRDSL